MSMCHFRAQNSPVCPEQFLGGTNHYYYFHLPIGLFHWVNFKNILKANPELRGCIISGPQIVHLPQAKNFLKKMINLIFICLLALFVVQHFKKILTGPVL